MRVFVSSVYEGLKQVRAQLIDNISRSGQIPIAMESFGARPEQPLLVCLEELRSSNVMVLILGPKYGSIEPNSGLSYTYLEFREAIDYGIPILGFELEGAADSAEGQEFREEVYGKALVDRIRDPVELPARAMASLLKFVKDSPNLVGQFKTFQEGKDFFSAMLHPDSPFNHTYRLVGNEDLMNDLDSFLDGDSCLGLLYGAGGTGKSRILWALCERREGKRPRLLFLSERMEATAERLKELPSDSVCVVVDDAHRLASLSDMVRVLFGGGKPNRTIKILLTSRPYASESIDYSLRCLPEGSVTRFRELTVLDRKTTALALAKQVLPNVGTDTQELLVKASDGNPLIITVGGSLIRSGGIDPRLLSQRTEFRSRALQGLLSGLPDKLDGDVNALKLLECIAGIGPIHPADQETVESLSSFLHCTPSSLWRSLDQLERHHSLLLRRGRTLRVQPDVLSDHLLFKASVVNGQSTGFVREVFDHFRGSCLSRLLTNATELEWRCQLEGQNINVLGDAWRIIERQLPDMSHTQRLHVLDVLKEPSWFAPQQVWRIVRWILDHPDALPDSNEFLRKIGLCHKDVLYRIPGLLAHIAWRREHTAECAALLWRMAADDDRRPNAHPECPMRVLQDILSYDPRKSLDTQLEALKGLEMELANERVRAVERDVSQVLSVVLTRDPVSSRSDGRSFSISNSRLPSKNPKIQELRAIATRLLGTQATAANPKLALAAVDAIRRLLEPPHGMFGRRVSDEELASWVPESRACALLLLSVANGTPFDVVAFEIQRILDSLHQGRFQKRVLEECDSDLHIIRERPTFELFRWLLPNYKLVRPSVNWREDQKELERRLQAAAEGFWRIHTVDSILEELCRALTEMRQAGIECSGAPFIKALLLKKRTDAPEFARTIVEGRCDPLKMEVGVVFERWLTNDPGAGMDALTEATDRSIASNDTALSRGIAVGYSSWGLLKLGSNPGQHLMNIRRLIEFCELSIKKLALYGLHYAKGICDREVVDLLVAVDFGSDAQLLDEALSVIDRTYGVSPDLLTSTDIEILIGKIGAVSELDDQLHHVEQFLALASARTPEIVIRMLLERVRQAASLEDDSERNWQPLPYVHFGDAFRGMHVSPQYKDLMRKIRDEIRKKDLVYGLWIPMLFALASDNFCDDAMEILREWSTSEDKDLVIGAAQLVHDAECNFAFSHADFVKELLVNAERLGGECLGSVRSSLYAVTLSGETHRAVGEPSAKHVNCKRLALERAELSSQWPVVAHFYRELAKGAQREIDEELARDEELSDE